MVRCMQMTTHASKQTYYYIAIYIMSKYMSLLNIFV